MESLDNKYKIELSDMFEEYSLNQLVTKPTHQNGGLIDLVITSDNLSIQDISIHEDGVGSDYHPIRFKVACQLHSNINVKEIRIRNFSKLNLNKIKEDLFDRRYFQDRHCPIKKKTFKPRPTSVWCTNDLREFKRKHRRLERDNTLENKGRYQQVKCNYNWELKKARIVYYKRCIGENKTFSSYHETSETELQNIIMYMNSKSCLDPIPTWLVKSSFNELKMAMLYIVNRSLVIENTFSETLKHAIVTPSLKDKDGHSEDYYSYRPISNTAFLSKMLEKIALSQINCHIEKYNLHAKQQSGYR